MAYKDLVTNLTKEIALFQSMGGNIYSPRRTLPFYERLRSAGRAYQRETGEKIPMEQIYSDCGVKFDRDYYHFTLFLDNLASFATPQGTVDSLKRTRATQTETEAKSYLNFHANEIGLAPGEYLILMTDYRFENLTISGDYVSFLQQRFSKAYPNGLVKNLKAENTSLYWALKHFQEYAPEELSYDEALAFFGMKNISTKKPPEPKITKPIIESEVVEDLTDLFPTREIKDIYTLNPKLYYDVVKLAVKNDQTVQQWFACHGMSYAQGNQCARLSRYQVDATEHEAMLLSMREELLQEYDIENADNIDMFRINLDIAKRISKELYPDKHITVEENENTDTTITEQTALSTNLEQDAGVITTAVKDMSKVKLDLPTTAPVTPEE
ncbi:MAG: hypothetical protein IKA31_05065 [Clostridia bacterium]|nr:hypothetical protein [Clostridia bacterium]